MNRTRPNAPLAALLFAGLQLLSACPLLAGESDLLPVRIQGKIGFINESGVLVSAPQWNDYDVFTAPFAQWVNGHLWVTKRTPDGDAFSTFLNREGNAITEFGLVQPDFMVTPTFDGEGTAYIELQSGGYAVINRDGKILHTHPKDWCGRFSEGLMAVPVGGAWGFIDPKGSFVIAPTFDAARNFSEGLAWVAKEGEYGAINRTGRFVVGPKYAQARPFNDGVAWVQKGGKWGAIDTLGRVLQSPTFGGIYETHGPYAILRVQDLWGLADARNGVLLPLKYEQVVFNAWGRPECFFKFKKAQKWGLVNGEGRILVRPVYDRIGNLCHNFDYFAVEQDEKAGLCDLSGRIVRPLIYDHAPALLHEGLAAFRMDGKVGFMDAHLQVAVSPACANGHVFSEGLAEVELDCGRSGYINRQGDFVVPANYLGGDMFTNGFAAVYKLNPDTRGRFLWGVVNRSGEEVIPCIYDKTAVRERIVAVVKDDSIGYSDLQGRWIWELPDPAGEEKSNHRVEATK